MKRITLLLICFLSAMVAHGQEPEPPTPEWCEWAFRQLPKDRALSEADSTAFSAEFYELLKKAIEAKEWEKVHFPNTYDKWNHWTYWYSGITGPLPSDINTVLTIKVRSVEEKRATVVYTILPPSIFNEYHMDIVYENSAWRIDDWEKFGLEYWNSMRELAELAIDINEEWKRLVENGDSDED